MTFCVDSLIKHLSLYTVSDDLWPLSHRFCEWFGSDGPFSTSAKEVIFSLVSVCLLVCQQDYTNTTERISSNCGWRRSRIHPTGLSDITVLVLSRSIVATDQSHCCDVMGSCKAHLFFSFAQFYVVVWFGLGYLNSGLDWGLHGLGSYIPFKTWIMC